MAATDSTRPGAPLVSVSMIVRNEARRLPRFLDAVAGLADEVCITDTGSTDATVAIARARGCIIQTFPWCDDFAAARNAALLPCSGHWILSLDADECIARPDHAAVLALALGPRDRCYRFVTRNYTDEPTASGFVWSRPGDELAAGYRGWFPSSKVRLFPNLPGAAFEGPVHEFIHASLGRLGISAADAPVPVHHYPFRDLPADAHARKQDLYLALGRRKVTLQPDDANARHELGDQYLDLGEYRKAIECYREAVRIDPKNPVWLRDLGAALILAGQLPQALRALGLSARMDASDATCWRNLGVARVRLGEWPDARYAFERAYAIDPEHPENQRYLAIAREACGDRDGAVTLLEALLARFPDHVEARALYEQLQES